MSIGPLQNKIKVVFWVCLCLVSTMAMGQPGSLGSGRQFSSSSQFEEKPLVLQQTDVAYHDALPYTDTTSVTIWNYLDSAFTNLHITDGRPHGLFYSVFQPGISWDKTRFIYRFRNEDHLRRDISESYYRATAPWVRIRYGLGQTQENSVLAADFGIQFKEKFDFSVDYDNTRDLGDYFNQHLRHNSAGIHWSYRDTVGHEFHIHYVGNQREEKMNGGIPDTINLNDTLYKRRLNVPVHLESGVFRQEDHTFLAEWVQPIRRESSDQGLFLDIGLGRTNSYRSLEKVKAIDSVYFVDYGLDTSQIHYKTHSNFWTSSAKLRWKGPIDAYAGITYRNLEVKQKEYDSFIAGKKNDSLVVEKPESDRYTILEGEAGLRGKFNRIETDTRLWMGTGLSQTEWTLDHNSRISVLSNRLFVDLKLLWQHHFLDLNQAYFYRREETSISDFDMSTDLQFEPKITYKRGPYQFSTGLQLLNTSGKVVLSETGQLFQSNENQSASVLTGNLSLNPRHIIFETAASYKLHSTDLYPAPALLIANSVGYHREVFQNRLQFIIALKTQYMQDFKSPYLHAYYSDWLIGDDDLQIDEAWQSSIVFSFRVKRFQASIQYQNLSGEITKKASKFLSAYPYMEPTLRIGVSWMFIN